MALDGRGAQSLVATETQLPVLSQLLGRDVLETFPFFVLPRAPGQPKIDHLRRLHLGAYPTEECKSCTR